MQKAAVFSRRGSFENMLRISQKPGESARSKLSIPLNIVYNGIILCILFFWFGLFCHDVVSVTMEEVGQSPKSRYNIPKHYAIIIQLLDGK